MKKAKRHADYETPSDSDILAAYLHKNGGRSEARRLRRHLRKVVYAR